MGDPIIDAEERLRTIESEQRLRTQVEGRTVQAPGPVAPPFPVQPAPAPPTDQFPDIAPPGLANPPLFLTPAPPPQQDPQSFFGNLMGVLGTPGEAVLGVLGGIPKLPKLPFIPEPVQGMGGRFLGSLIGMGPEEINTFAENNAKAWSVISGNSFDIAFFDLKSKLEQLARLSRERPPTEQVISAAAEIAAGISAGKAIVGGVKAVTKRVAPEVTARGVADITPSFGVELGRGTYFSTSREIAKGYAEGRAPFAAGATPRTRIGTEVVSEFNIPSRTKIFSRDNVVDNTLWNNFSQAHPRFASIWSEEWSSIVRSRNNIWAAAEQSGLLKELQETLTAKGFKGARHSQGPGQFDYAIWDQSIIKEGGGGIRLFRGAPKVAVDALALEGRLPVVQKLAQEIPTLKRMENITAKATREAIGAKAVAARETFEAGLEAAGGPTGPVMKETLARFKGDLPKRPTFTPLINVLDEADVMDLRQMVIDASDGDIFEVVNNWKALDELFFGRVPQKRQIERLEAIFGPEVAEEILKKRSTGSVRWEAILDVLNIPKTFVSSYDLSAPLRQGVILAPGHPKEFGGAFKEMFKTVFNPDNARIVDEAIRDHHLFEFAEDVGLFYDPSLMGKAGSLLTREEAFMSRYAKNIPGVEWSQRMYSTFLNKFRHDVFYNIADEWMKTGKTHEEFQELARWINWATGRGPLLPGTEQLQPVLNVAFFSPRFATSRLMMPVELTRAMTPQKIGNINVPGQQGMTLAMRKVIVKDLTKAVVTGMTIMGMVKMALGDKVQLEKDPRSSNFGKMVIDGIHYDYWGGMQPVARYTANLMLGQRKTSSGELQDIDITDTLGRYIRSKMSPIGGIATDIITGTTFAGEEVKAEPGFVAGQAVQRLVPLFIQDIIEAIASESIDGGISTVPGNIREDPTGAIGKLLMALPGGLGVGVQSYKTFHNMRDAIAIEKYGVPFNSLGEPSTELPGELNRMDAMDTVRNDPRLLKYIEARANDVSMLTPQQQVREGFILLKKRNQEIEEEFVPSLELKGRDLRKAIQGLKTARFEASQTVFGEDADSILRELEPQHTLAAIQSEYWEIEVPEKIINGRQFLDFDAAEQMREKVLQKGLNLGFSRRDILQRASDRFSNPEVRRVVEEYERDLLTLRKYFDAYKRIIRKREDQIEYLTVPESQWSAKLKALAPAVARVRDVMRLKTRKTAGGIEELLQKWEFVTVSIERKLSKGRR